MERRGNAALNGMNTKTNAVTGEGIASRVTIDDWRSGRFTVDEFRERIAEQCGQPFDGTIEAVIAEEENDDTRTVGLPANEADDEADENSDDRAWNEVERYRDESVGDGETDAERNA